jgi:hypothetical protein
MSSKIKSYLFDVEDNTGPRAIITPDDQRSVLGAVVRLDGRASFDTSTTPSGVLNYHWRFSRVPIGSQVELEGFTFSESDNSAVIFAPDITGIYEVELVVDDGSISSSPFIASVDVNRIAVPNNLGIIPDAGFIWNYLSDFWNIVDGRHRYEVIWSSAIQIAASEILKLYQYDYNKSIKDIQELAQRRWLSYESGLSLSRTEITGILADDQAGVSAYSVAVDPVNGVALEKQEDFFNLISIPLSEGSFVKTSYGSSIHAGRLVTFTGRSYTMARSSDGRKAINEGNDGATSIGGDTFIGSVFDSSYEGQVLHIRSGPDKGSYLINLVLADNLLQVVHKDGSPVSFLATSSGITYSVTTRSSNVSNFFADRKTVPTILAGQFWRFSSTIVSDEWDFEEQGCSIGDLLEVEVIRTDLNLVGSFRVQVVGVDRNRLSFVFNTEDLVDGQPASGLSEDVQEQLAEALQVTGLIRDKNNQLQYTLEAELVRDTIQSLEFKRSYFETSLTPEHEIDLKAFKVKLRPLKIVRNSKIRINRDVVSVPMLQEYIKQPDLGEIDGQLHIIGRDGKLHPIDREPYILVENQDYLIDDSTQISGFARTFQNIDEIHIPRGDLVDRNVQPGDSIELTVGSTKQIYNVRRVLDDETLRVFPVPSQTATGIPFVIIRRVGGKFVRFVDGSFSKDRPAPNRLWAEVTYFSNDSSIEANFGVLVGVRRDDLRRRTVSTPYKNVVEGLMFALTNGPVYENLRLAAQILLGLPFAQNRGMVVDINPSFRIREDGSPRFGRILIEAIDKNGKPIGMTNAYLYPQGRQLVDPDDPDGWIPATPNEAGLAINPSTGVEYVVGDVVEKFAILSKGVSIQDYLADPTLTERFSEQGTISAFLTQYHSFQLRINADVTSPSDVNLAADFVKEAKPHYTKISAGLLKVMEDFVSVDDVLLFGRKLDWFDTECHSLPMAIKFDQGSGDDEVITFEGVMYSRYKKGIDLQTTQGSNQVVSPTGGFVNTLPLQSFDSPFIRGEDLLVIEGGPNAGEYTINSVDSDTEASLNLSGEFETLDDQVFSVYRSVKNPIFHTDVTVVNGNTVVGTDSGLFSAGVAVGDILTFHSGGSFDASYQYIITSVDPQGPNVTVTPAIREASGTYPGNIWRESLSTKYFLNEEVDTPFTAALSNGSPLIVFDSSGSDMDQLPFISPGDFIVDGDSSFLVLDFRPDTLTAFCSPAPGYDSTGPVKIVRANRPSTPISSSLLDRTPGELLVLELSLPTGNQDLLTTSSSSLVTTDSSEDFSALGVIPGDYLVLFEGADSSTDIGYGEGVFPITRLPNPDELELAVDLTETNGSPGIRYGIQRRVSL